MARLISPHLQQTVKNYSLWKVIRTCMIAGTNLPYRIGAASAPREILHLLQPHNIRKYNYSVAQHLEDIFH